MPRCDNCDAMILLDDARTANAMDHPELEGSVFCSDGCLSDAKRLVFHKRTGR